MKKVLPWIFPLVRPALFIGGGLLVVELTHQTYIEAMRWWSPLCTVINLITIAGLFLLCRYEGISFSSLWNRGNEHVRVKSTLWFVLAMLLIGVGGMLGFSFLFYQGLPELLVQPIPVWLAIINLFLLPITVVFAEMPLYFGYSLNRIRKDTGKPAVAILYTVFFYALQHSFIPLLWDIKYLAFRFLSFLPLMIFLGVLYHKRQTMKPMMIGHGVMDLSTGIQILIFSIIG